MLRRMEHAGAHGGYGSLTVDDLVTGEAVALDLPPASIAMRMVSGFIDVVATILLLLVVIFLYGAATVRASGALAHVALIGTLITVFLVAPTTMETLTRGKSLGKLATGLRTVRDDAGPISFQHAFVRTLIGFVEIYAFTGVPAFFSALVSKRGKRLGDHAAGTYVVRERVRLTLVPPRPMPPHLSAWAASADVVALPTPLALGVRQFLGRAPTMAPGPRAELARRLVEQVAPYVAPAPPPGTFDEDLLAAVVATRRDRDHARLQREAALVDRLVSRASAGQTRR
jgi:uncharacterized RDD family membrane protein YckC